MDASHLLRQSYIVFLLALTAIVFLGGCSPAIHMKPDQYLLKSYPAFSKAEKEHIRFELDSLKKTIASITELGESSIDYDVLYYAVKSRPNRKMLLVKPYLMLWNLGKTFEDYDTRVEKVFDWFFPQSTLPDSIINVLLNTAGEKPVIIDTALLRKDAANIRSVYFSRGYFNADVNYRVDTCKSWFNRQQARVTFLIDENIGWVIDTIIVQVHSTEIQRILASTSTESHLKDGDLYNENNFALERARITELMRNRGYFKFTPGMVSFVVDTLPYEGANVEPNNERIREYKSLRIWVRIDENPRTYRINELSLLFEPSHVKFTDVPVRFRPAELTPEKREMLGIRNGIIKDTIPITFKIYQRAMNKLNLDYITSLITVKEGQMFSLQNEQRTMRRLQNQGVFRYTLIHYEANDSLGLLDMTIQAQMTEKFQFKVGLEGFSQNDQSLRSNLPGFGGHILFRDKNVFKGGERLEISANGNLSFYFPGEGEPYHAFYQLGSKASLIFPKLIIPFMNYKKLVRFNPSTSFSANLNSQRRNEFDRTILGMTWNYSWFHSSLNQKIRSSLSPYVINFISSNLDSAFKAQIDSIDNDFLRSFTILDFQSRFSSKFNYKFTWSDYTTTREHPTQFFQPSFEFGGNTPFLIDYFTKRDGSYMDGRLDSIYYGQYLKFSVEYKRYYPLGKKKEFVWRVFTGVADPWNFSKQVPFDSRFFAGGTNSLRGWQSNTLGPGTFVRNDSTGNNSVEFLISPGGEFVFEANVELRMNVYKFIELAFFADVGNVWFLPTSNFEFESGKLSKNTFYQLGWDAGIGFRFDFTFFIFRVDLAQQIYAPDKMDFVVKSFPKDLGAGRFQLNFGIGYPF